MLQITENKSLSFMLRCMIGDLINSVYVTHHHYSIHRLDSVLKNFKTNQMLVVDKKNNIIFNKSNSANDRSKLRNKLLPSRSNLL